jgi:hypothetical protein
VSHDGLIKLAEDLQGWPLLETAVDHKLEEQEEFVRWWGKNVRRAGQPERIVAEPEQFSAEDAEAQTGITKQQVSKWAKRLINKGKYRTATNFTIHWLFCAVNSARIRSVRNQ